MQKTIVVNFNGKDEEEFTSFMEELTKYIRLQHKNITTEIYDTPLGAFAAQEGPFRIEQLIENEHMERPEDEKLLKEMGEDAASEIEDNLVYDDSTYSSILDNDTLEQIAIDNAVSVFKGHLSELSEHDRKIAEDFIGEWDEDDGEEED